MTNNTLSRRHAFKIVGLTGAAVALRGTAAYAEAPAATPPATQGAGFYRTHVGEFEVTIVSDGQFPLAPFPTIGSNASEAEVNAVLAEYFLEPSKLMAQVNTLLVRKPGSDDITVVDTGSGKLFGAAAGFAKQNLANAGMKPEEVKHVILTHLHPDHVGGAVGDDGKLAFSNAEYHVHQAEKDFWTSASPDLSKSGVPEAMRGGMIQGARKFITAAGDKLKTFSGESTEIMPGITTMLTGGHTPGHCVLRFESGGESLIYVTDLVVQSVLVLAHPEWFVGFDTDMAGTVKVRQTLFARLAGDKSMICGSHLPFPSVGHVKKAGSGYEFVPAPWSWA